MSRPSTPSCSPALSLWNWCFTATGQARLVVVPTLVSALVNLLLSILLTRSLDLVGPLLGTALANIGFGLWYFPWLLRRVFGTPPAALAGALAWPGAGGVLYAAGLWWLARWYPPGGWASLLTEMAVSGSLFLAIGIAIIVADPANRGLWRSRLRALGPAVAIPTASIPPAPLR